MTNEKPRAQNQHFFTFELEYPIEEFRSDLITFQGRKKNEPTVDLKFKKKLYLNVNLGKMRLEVYISKYVKYSGNHRRNQM